MADMLNVLDNVGDKISNFDPTNLGGLSASPMWAKMWLFVQGFAWFAIVLFAALAFWKYYLSYNIRVRVVTKRGGNILDIQNDIAKIVRDEQGKVKLELLKTRSGGLAYTCPVPNSKYKYRQGKLDYYDLWLDNNKQIHPIEIGISQRVRALFNKKEKEEVKKVESKHSIEMENSLNPIKFEDMNKEDEVFVKPRPEFRDAWARYEDKKLIEKFQKKTWLQEYMPLVVITTLSVTVILVFFFLFKSIGSGLTSLSSSFSAIAHSCVSLG